MNYTVCSMRIIAGDFRGRRFTPPADNWPTRPTTDIAKEGLFNILTNRIDFEDTKMLDLFGGSGSHTYEALSRGCRDITYVDRFAPAIKYTAGILGELGMTDFVQLHRKDALRFVEKSTDRFDYIFAGPPYGMPRLDEIPSLVAQSHLSTVNGLFVLEHNANHDFAQSEGFVEERSYGGTRFSFFHMSVSK